MKNLYAIRDNVAGEITGGVHVFSADASAVRFFTDVARDKQTAIAAHLPDYDLLLIAVFDERTGIVDASSGPSLVVSGAALAAAFSPPDKEA